MFPRNRERNIYVQARNMASHLTELNLLETISRYWDSFFTTLIHWFNYSRSYYITLPFYDVSIAFWN